MKIIFHNFFLFSKYKLEKDSGFLFFLLRRKTIGHPIENGKIVLQGNKKADALGKLDLFLTTLFSEVSSFREVCRNAKP